MYTLISESKQRGETKFKFTKFPVRKLEAIIDKDAGTSSSSVEWHYVSYMRNIYHFGFVKILLKLWLLL